MKFKTLEQIHNLKQDKDYLWDVVDVLRKEIKAEKQKNLELNDEYDFYVYNIEPLKHKCDDYQKQLAELLKHKYDLKAEYKELQAENETLKEENDSLKDEAVKWNRKYNKLNDDYNNDHKVHNDYEDGLLKEIKELKDSSQYPKEYQKEAEEYFHHNPQAEKLYFFIKDDDDCINEDIDKDDAICTIYKPIV